jgi:hypothetical protein
MKIGNRCLGGQPHAPAALPLREQHTVPVGLGGSGREADHSPPTSADVKKMWVCTSPPPHAFMKEPGYLSQCRDWRRPGRTRGRSSSPGKVKNFHVVLVGSGVHPASYPMGLKLPEREADHSPPAVAEFKKMWIYTSTPPYAFMS